MVHAHVRFFRLLASPESSCRLRDFHTSGIIPPMSLTAQQIAERIRTRLAVSPPPHSADGIAAGDPSAVITGIATTFVPTFEVLRRAADAGRNLIVTHESPYWNRNPTALSDDPLSHAKQQFIDAHKLVIYRLRESWQARALNEKSDGQLDGLAKALGWDQHRADGIYFRLPATTLLALARDIASRLKIHAARVIGDPRTSVSKVALTHGQISTPDLAKVLREPDVDAVVIGEPVEWEASPYFQDVIASGQKKGLIAIGLEASEEPGSGEVAAWLKSFISEVPVEWIPAGEPFAPQRWS
jgi:putative NIF3 family GTP cyclohydrolase 1 type 2